MLIDRICIFIGPCADGERQLKSESFIKKNAPVLSGLNYSQILKEQFKKRYKSCFVISKLPVQPWPQSKKLYISDNYFKNGELGSSFLNIKILRNLSYLMHTKRRIKKYLMPLLKAEKSSAFDIFVYEAWGPSLEIARFLKKKLKKCKVIIDIPDLPSLMNRINKNNLFGFIKQIEANHSNKLIKSYADGLVLFSKNMNEVFKFPDEKIIVSPGFVPYFNKEFTKINKKKIKLCYTGSLDSEACDFNFLLESIKKFNEEENYQLSLIIAGGGNTEFLQNFKYVNYVGNLSKSETRRIQFSSDVLVSFRENLTKFRYAFPSKIMEYLGSKKPILSYAMDSYTDDLLKFMYIVKEKNYESFKSNIFKIVDDSFDVKCFNLKNVSLCSLYSVDFLMENIIQLFLNL